MELDEVATQFYHMHTQVDKSEHMYFAFISFSISVLILGFFISIGFGFLPGQTSNRDERGNGD